MWVGKSGVLEHQSGNISETRKDRGKVTMEGLQKLTNALLNGTIPDLLRPPLTQDWGFATRKTSIATCIISGTGKFGWNIIPEPIVSGPFKILEKSERGRIQGLSKFLQLVSNISN